MTSVNDIYRAGVKRLEAGGVENAAFEAQCLTEKAFSLDKTSFITHRRQPAEAKSEELFLTFLNRRLEGEPLQYILGEWSFMGFDFKVGEGVLIPRDDTEVLVRLCVDFLKNRRDKVTVDLCSGSGAIAVALDRLAGATVTAVEIDDDAFEYLKKNVRLNKTDVVPAKADAAKFFKNHEDGTLDLVVSNPPYIKSDEIDALQKEVRREPRLALDGGRDGLDFYRIITRCWSKKLKKGGALAFELGEGQSEYVKRLMSVCGLGNFKTKPDLGGTQRAIIGTLL